GAIPFFDECVGFGQQAFVVTDNDHVVGANFVCNALVGIANRALIDIFAVGNKTTLADECLAFIGQCVIQEKLGCVHVGSAFGNAHAAQHDRSAVFGEQNAQQFAAWLLQSRENGDAGNGNAKHVFAGG